MTGEELVRSVSKRRTKPENSLHKERKQTQRTLTGQCQNTTKPECQYCGLTHERGADKCPAYGKECTYCHKRNHFARKCRLKPKGDTRQRIHVATNRDESEDDDECLTRNYADSASTGCSGDAMQRQLWVELSATGLCQHVHQWKRCQIPA